MRRFVIGGVLAVLVCAGAVLAISRPPRPDVGVLVVDTTTGTRERITAVDGTAAWSRDGRTIFVSGDGAFARFATDGRRIARRTLRTPDVAVGEVAVSPDARRIAYVAAPGDPGQVNTGDLIVAPLEGGQRAVRLTRARGTPAWSPDGRYLAVERWSESAARGGTGDDARVVVIRSAGNAGASRSAGAGGQPSWLPDGRLLLYDADRLILTRAGDRERRVVLSGVYAGGKPWDLSSDGTRLAVAASSRDNATPHLTIVDLTSGQSQLLSSEPTSDARWSADNTQLAVVAGERILLLDPSGTAAARELTRIPDRGLASLAWSPDGRYLAVTAHVPSHGD